MGDKLKFSTDVDGSFYLSIDMIFWGNVVEYTEWNGEKLRTRCRTTTPELKKIAIKNAYVIVRKS